MVPPDVIGWASSAVLVATIAKQVHRQWTAGTSEGVSKWLFVGQLAASVGFTVYSVLLGNLVFVVTNATLLVAAATGLFIVFRHRQEAPSTRRRAAPSVRGRGARPARVRLPWHLPLAPPRPATRSAHRAPGRTSGD